MVTITLDGADALISRLAAMGPAAARAAEDAVTATALEIERDAKQLAPVDTGRLRAGINARTGGLSAEVVSDAPYSQHVEFGTRKSRAQPFMVPAAEAARPRFAARMKAAATAGANAPRGGGAR